MEIFVFFVVSSNSGDGMERVL